MTSSSACHRLGAAELRALSVGDFDAEVLDRLRAAQLSKNLFLWEALRRAATRDHRGDDTDLIEAASSILGQAQAHAPEVVADVLALPHFSMWAADWLARSRADPAHQVALRQRPPPADLAPLATFAAAAAVRARLASAIRVPVRGGVVTLPGLGQARIGARSHSGWAWLRVSDDGATISSDRETVRLPADLGEGSSGTRSTWTPALRVRAEADGLVLSAILETSDPFLARLGPLESVPRRSSWQRLISATWRLLARHHRMSATGLATVVSTLVPLRASAPERPTSATSGWAWGAIALSLTPDEASLAETLVHELHHLVMAAIEDLGAVVTDGTGQQLYAPWRDDPRPVAALLHGTYAHLGVSRFWRRHRRVARPEFRLRADIEFARGRQAALHGATTLADSGPLTDVGSLMVGEMHARLTRWQAEPTPIEAQSAAAEMAAEHYLRWRLAHLRPDAALVDGLAATWPPENQHAGVLPEPSVTLASWSNNCRGELAYLLEQKYRFPERMARLSELDNVTAVHVPFLVDDLATARKNYLRQIIAHGQAEGWVGLILTLRRLSGRPWTFPVRERPEIFAAVFDRIRVLTGSIAQPEALIEWLRSPPY